MAERAGRLPDEFDLIERYFKPLATDPGAFGLKDDAAVLAAPPGTEIVVSSDTVVGGVHFFPDDPPSAIARKALRVNISDLVAKGAAPFAYTLSLALPEATTGNWLAAFARALAGDQGTYGVALVGGDTTRSPAMLVVAITAFGRVDAGAMVRRGGGRAGDAVYVSGTIGDAVAGLMLRTGELSSADVGRGAAGLEKRYLFPEPRAALAGAVSAHARGALDVSDGLWADLAHLCAASGVTARIDAESVPMSPAVRRLAETMPGFMQRALTGGDDYEVLAAVPPGACAAFEAAAAAAGVPVSRIGALVRGAGVPSIMHQGSPLPHPGALGHLHF